MATIIEGTIKLQGDEWYTKTWLPEGRPRAILIFIHGFSDHINQYCGYFPAMASRGIASYGYDRRGWGRSVKKPADWGKTGPTSMVMDDIVAFITATLDAVEKDGNGNVPVFVMGHSMGGMDVATLMAAGEAPYKSTLLPRIRGWLFESPFFGFTAGEQPSALKIALGRFASHLLPHVHLKHVIPVEYMTRDPVIVAKVRNDPLCHDTGTLEGMAGLLDRVGELTAGRCVPHASVQSIWLGHGTADRGTSYAASKKWFESAATAAVADKTLRTYEGWYHMLHAEPEADRELYYKEVGDWIVERSGVADETVPSSAHAADPATEPAAKEAAKPVEEEAAPVAEQPAAELETAAVVTGQKEGSKL